MWIPFPVTVYLDYSLVILLLNSSLCLSKQAAFTVHARAPQIERNNSLYRQLRSSFMKKAQRCRTSLRLSVNDTSPCQESLGADYVHVAANVALAVRGGQKALRKRYSQAVRYTAGSSFLSLPLSLFFFTQQTLDKSRT